MLSTKTAAKQDFIPVMRELVRAYQAFASYDAKGYEGTDLTVSQADVLFTLGNTDGLSFKEIGELTLITKGTLTGVIDRMEAKGLVKRRESPLDRRVTLVQLTRQGEKLFEKLFPRQIAHIKRCFDQLSKSELSEISKSLSRLREIFS
ncbi:MAG: MarR family transcriptional regulator [Thioalkalispiraceae bacterium]